MTDEEDFLNRAAFDALANLTGTRGERELADLMRSGAPIDPSVRDLIAEALEDGRLRIHRGGNGKGGRPRPVIERLDRGGNAVAIGNFYLERITPCGNEKAALADTCATFEISEKTARKYRDTARNWNAKVEQWRRSRGTKPLG